MVNTAPPSGALAASPNRLFLRYRRHDGQTEAGAGAARAGSFCQKRSKTASSASSSSPGPWSRTAMTARPLLRGADTSMALPGECGSRRWSPGCPAPGGDGPRRPGRPRVGEREGSPVGPVRPQWRRCRRRRRGRRSRQGPVRSGAPGRAEPTASRSSTRPFMRADSSSIRRMMVALSTRGLSAPRRNSSAKPWIDVSGVRSSCDASARNCRSRPSVASRSEKACWISSSMVLKATASSPTSVFSCLPRPAARITGRDFLGRVGHPLEGRQAAAQYETGADRKDQ